MLPDIGPEVVGASYCPLDGQCNSMRLFWGLHTAFARLGGHYRSDHRVESLTASGGGFVASTAAGSVAAGKVVIAAGNDSRRLGAMVGIDAQVRPQRGQVLVTERMKPFLHYPTITVRQADEGSVMLGDAIEEENPSLVVGTDVLAKMADRARRMFPGLSKVNILRTWAAQRVMTKDGCPIYDESREHPGAFVANCHSGVTLAPRHAQTLAPLIASSRVKAELPAFGTGRFDVSTVH
jgi:glycine/D-amino acid oxidase-like deaminating enzyme